MFEYIVTPSMAKHKFSEKVIFQYVWRTWIQFHKFLSDIKLSYWRLALCLTPDVNFGYTRQYSHLLGTPFVKLRFILRRSNFQRLSPFHFSNKSRCTSLSSSSIWNSPKKYVSCPKLTVHQSWGMGRGCRGSLLWIIVCTIITPSILHKAHWH